MLYEVITRQQIRAVSWNQAQVEEASLLIVLTADLKSWEKEPSRYWVNAPQQVQDYLVPAIGCDRRLPGYAGCRADYQFAKFHWYPGGKQRAIVGGGQ